MIMRDIPLQFMHKSWNSKTIKCYMPTMAAVCCFSLLWKSRHLVNIIVGNTAPATIIGTGYISSTLLSQVTL